MTQSYTTSSTFTIVHARQLASKIAADMNLCATYYGKPGETQIRDYAEELAQHLNEGYVSKYEFGFKKDNRRVVCWQYTVSAVGVITTDDRAGRVFSYADIAGAVYYNFLWKSQKFWELPGADQERFKSTLPFQRTPGDEPVDGNGYWASDKNYSAGNVGLGRKTYRPLS